jgi:hypothetical protein
MSEQLYPVYAAGPSPRTQLPLNTSQLAAGPGVAASRRWRAAGPAPRAEAAGSGSASSRRTETDNATAARTPPLLPPNGGIDVVAATKIRKRKRKQRRLAF